MAFDRPTLTELSDRITNDFETRISGIGTLLRRSMLKIMAKVIAGAIHLVYGYLDYMSRQLFASSADTEFLDSIGAEYGIERKAASKAIGSVALTGTAGTAVPALTKLQSAASTVYETDAAVTIPATAAITASEAGEEGNDDGGIALTYVSPIAGADSTVYVTSSGLAGGSDAEGYDAYRERILLRKRTPPHGGTHNDLEQWALEVSGVTRAWTIEQYQGIGTVGLAFVRDGDTPITPTLAQRQTVKDYIIEHEDPETGEIVGIPVTMEPGFFIVGEIDGAPLQVYTLNFTVTVYPESVTNNEITAALADVILRDGGPATEIRLSRLMEAISAIAGEQWHTIDIINGVAPSSSVLTTNVHQVHVMGTVTRAAFNF